MGASVYLIFGEDEYLVSAKAKELVNGLVPDENRALGLEILDGRADTADAAVDVLARCAGGLQTMGLLGGSKVVWLQDVNFLADNQVGRSETVKSHLNGLADTIRSGLPWGQILIATAPRVDKRYAFYKACKASGEVHEFDVPDKGYLAERQASVNLKRILAETGMTMTQNVASAFLERVGIQTRQIVSEVEKLAAFIGERNEITLSDIESVTSASRSVLTWDLADAVGGRDLGRALGVLRKLMFQKESPIGLIIGLERRIRDLTIYREALDKGWLSRTAGGRGGRVQWGGLPDEVDATFSEGLNKDPRSTHPYRAGLLAEQARGFPSRHLRRCQEALADAHTQLVSSTVPQSMILELLLIRLLA